MKAKIKEEYKEKFKSTFRTVVMGQTLDVSLSQAESEAEKYALTGMGYMYVNSAKLKEQVLSRQKKAELVVLDMNNATRGTAFEKGSSPKAKSIASFEERQAKARAKMFRRKGIDPTAVVTSKKKKASKKRTSKKK